MITTALVAIAVTGATYTIDWQADDLHLTGVVDTAADALTWDSQPDWLETPLTWPALAAGEVIRPWGENGRHELVTYDIPDDWSGVMGDWAFISEFGIYYNDGQRYGHTYWGLGGNLWTGNCRRENYPYYNCHYNQWLYPEGDIHKIGSLTATLVEIQPVSPTRILGDANYDGLFDSSDMVAVFAIGKYQTGQPAVWSEGDWDQNGLFDPGDMVAAFAAGDYERPPAAVPEPSGLLLLVVGVLGCRRRV